MKNSALHWLFWGIYLFINHLIFAKTLFAPTDLLISFIFTLCNAGAAYSVTYTLFPKYFATRKFGLFIIAVLITILLFTTVLVLSFIGVIIITGVSEFNDQLLFVEFIGPALYSNCGGILFFAVPYFISQRMQVERLNRQLEKESLEARLQNLKSQLHPHFLFNALNNIYFLIKKDPDTAAGALAGFSDLLRFQLYEAQQSYVSLKMEITYLKQYAEIALLRKGKAFEVEWKVPERMDNIQIKPLLLIPLLENAFKHSGSDKGKILIQINLEGTLLSFSILNTKDSEKNTTKEGLETGGIGLENVRKRLSLLYPHMHDLKIKNSSSTYEVNLSISLKEHQLL